MHRFSRSKSASLLLFFLAAGTACSRRVDPRDRNAPSDGTSQVPGPSEREPAAAAKPVKPAARLGELRHVGPNELFAAVRGLKQKGVVLNVWATWCAPCREELAMLGKVSKDYAGRGITVLPLSVDDPDGEPLIPEVLSSFGFKPPYYVVQSPIEEMKAALFKGWSGNIPVSFLLDADASRRYFFNAEVYENELTPKLDAMLAGTLPVGQSNFGVTAGKEL